MTETEDMLESYSSEKENNGEYEVIGVMPTPLSEGCTLEDLKKREEEYSDFWKQEDKTGLSLLTSAATANIFALQTIICYGADSPIWKVSSIGFLASGICTALCLIRRIKWARELRQEEYEQETAAGSKDKIQQENTIQEPEYPKGRRTK